MGISEIRRPSKSGIHHELGGNCGARQFRGRSRPARMTRFGGLPYIGNSGNSPPLEKRYPLRAWENRGAGQLRGRSCPVCMTGSGNIPYVGNGGNSPPLRTAVFITSLGEPRGGTTSREKPSRPYDAIWKSSIYWEWWRRLTSQNSKFHLTNLWKTLRARKL